MGVTKVLMASNDTLFNFEDTLGDRDDMMLSPRNAANHSVEHMPASSTTPQPPDTCKTPTNESYLIAYPVEYKPNDAYTDNNQLIAELKPNSLQLNFENLTNNLSDLLSPEQQKTFSEEINTIEQLSSDLSATIDATTNTLDDLKTCISVHLNDDTNNSKLDNSDNNECIAIDQHQANRATVSAAVVECDERADSLQKSIIDEAQEAANSTTTTTTLTNPKVMADNILNQVSDKLVENDTVFDMHEPNDSVKENKNPNLDFNNVTKSDDKCHLNKTFEFSQIDAKHESRPNNQPPNHLDAVHESVAELSGEEDPWVIVGLFIETVFSP